MSAVLAAVQAGVLFSTPRFNLDVSVPGPNIGGIDDGTELGFINAPLARIQARICSCYKFSMY